ncbi:hypothetical protein ACFVJ5_03835 [Nocardia sp. NPDC127606]|uniref:hypothetical protein n=1 Tax=Nocardia sp. NPDC127606 TaxID=3345406 RepID=UPI003631335C
MVEIPFCSADKLVLPESILLVQESYPWLSVERSAKSVLSTAAPAFRSEIDNLPLSVFGLNSGFFYLPAALALEWAAPVPIEDFLVALAVGHVFFAFQDSIVDGGAASPELCVIAHDALFEYLPRIAAIGWPSASPAVGSAHAIESHRRNYLLYSAAIANDLRHRSVLNRYTSLEIANLGWKAAPCNTPFEVVAARSGRQESVPDLLEAVKYFCAGLQLMDDLSDLAVDHADGNMTMALSHTLLHLKDAGLEHRSADADDILFAAEMSGVSLVSCQMALRMFSVAKEFADRVEATPLAELCDAWTVRAVRRIELIDESV